jgi:hypothetical protein
MAGEPKKSLGKCRQQEGTPLGRTTNFFILLQL